MGVRKSTKLLESSSSALKLLTNTDEKHGNFITEILLKRASWLATTWFLSTLLVMPSTCVLSCLHDCWTDLSTFMTLLQGTWRRFSWVSRFEVSGSWGRSVSNTDGCLSWHFRSWACWSWFRFFFDIEFFLYMWKGSWGRVWLEIRLITCRGLGWDL